MTRTCWLAAAGALLLALNAGPARCQEPAPESKDCCDKDVPCCVKGDARSCPKCDDTPCSTGTTRAASCCEECAGGCKCCSKCREAAACGAKGAAGTCCAQTAGGCGACAGTCPASGCCTKQGHVKKPGAVIFLPLPPLPGNPIPVPPVLPIGFAEPAPPMPPVYRCPPPGPEWQPAPAENVYMAEPGRPPCYAPPAMMAPPAVACSVPQPCRHASCACCLKVSAEDGKTHLEVAGCGETAMTCDSLVLKVSGSSPLKVAVADKQVQLSNSYLKATADCVARMSGDDCLVLEGNVHLDYHKDGKHTETAADRVVIGLADGSLKIEPVAAPDAKATWHLLAPDSPLQQVFSFWIGTFH
jgi:hypothetical protein